MNSDRPVKTPPARRGRPRSAPARARVLRAARELLDSKGPAAVTIEAVAARSGVSKPTIYRTWPNAQAVVMAALMHAPVPPAAARRRGSSLGALRHHLRGIADTFASRTGRNVTMMLASADAETELSKAFRHHFILARREEGRALLLAAVAHGDVRADLDVEIALDLLYGPIFFRVILGHAVVDGEFCDRLVAQLAHGLEAR